MIEKKWSTKQFLIALAGIVICIVLLGQLLPTVIAVVIVIAGLIAVAFVVRRLKNSRKKSQYRKEN